MPAVEVVYAEFPDALSQWDILLQFHAVHLLGPFQRDFQRGFRHAVLRCPIGVVIAICQVLRAVQFLVARVRRLDAGFLQQIVAKFRHDLFVEVHGIGRVDGVDQTFLVDGEVQEKGAVMAYATVIEVGQVLHAFHFLVFALVVEPAWADGHVAF